MICVHHDLTIMNSNLSVVHSDCSANVMNSKSDKKYVSPKTIDTPTYSATKEDRRQFLTALKSKGFNVINDLNALQEFLPGKTHAELQRAKSRSSKQTTRSATDVDDDPSELPPIEAWYSIVHERVPSLSKKDDFSNIFADILCNQMNTSNKKFKATDGAESCNNIPSSSNRTPDDNVMSHELNPNYEAIRLYLADILRGKYPPELSASDSLVVVSLIENLKTCLKKCNQEEARDFLEKSSLRHDVVDDNFHLTIGDDTAAGESDDIVCTAKRSADGGSASQVDQLSSTSASPTTVTDAGSNSAIGNGSTAALIRNSSDEQPQPEQQQQQPTVDGVEASPQLNFNQKLAAYREECINYPKIKRIYACLNPLSVPVDLLAQQHNELRAVMSELWQRDSEKVSHIISNFQNVNSP